jgi:hypothetical protein
MNMATPHSIHDRNERALEMLELAASKYEAALELEPKHPVILHALGTVRLMQSHLKCLCGQVEKAGPYFEHAVECYRRAIKERPDDEFLKQALKEATERGPPRYPRQFHQMPPPPPPWKELECTKHDEEVFARAQLDLQADPADSMVRAPACCVSQTISPAGLIIRTRLQLCHCLEPTQRGRRRQRPGSRPSRAGRDWKRPCTTRARVCLGALHCAPRDKTG